MSGGQAADIRRALGDDVSEAWERARRLVLPPTYGKPRSAYDEDFREIESALDAFEFYFLHHLEELRR